MQQQQTTQCAFVFVTYEIRRKRERERAGGEVLTAQTRYRAWGAACAGPEEETDTARSKACATKRLSRKGGGGGGGGEMKPTD